MIAITAPRLAASACLGRRWRCSPVFFLLSCSEGLRVGPSRPGATAHQAPSTGGLILVPTKRPSSALALPYCFVPSFWYLPVFFGIVVPVLAALGCARSCKRRGPRDTYRGQGEDVDHQPKLGQVQARARARLQQAQAHTFCVSRPCAAVQHVRALANDQST